MLLFGSRDVDSSPLPFVSGVERSFTRVCRMQLTLYFAIFNVNPFRVVKNVFFLKTIVKEELVFLQVFYKCNSDRWHSELQ